MRTNSFLIPAVLLAISAPAAAQERLPSEFRHLKPYQVVEAVSAEGRYLDLSAVQLRGLDSLRSAVRNERHRYEPAPSPKTHQNVRMLPMRTREQAYASALSLLTPEQRSRAAGRFHDPAYRPPVELRVGPAAAGDTTDPLRHHVAGAAPVLQNVGSVDPAADPLRHQAGGTWPARQADAATAVNPLSHRR